MPTGHVVFICTKPLQIMISMAIRDQLAPTHTAELHVVDNFVCASQISARIAEVDSSWTQVRLQPSRLEAVRKVRHIKPTMTFVDSDVGLKPYVFTALQSCLGFKHHLVVFEEGIGTYRRDIYPPGITRTLLHALGVGTYLGGSVHTKEVWVYNREEYVEGGKRRHTILNTIKPSLQEYISCNSVVLKSIFWPSYSTDFSQLDMSKSHCVLYQPAWTAEPSVLNSIQNPQAENLIKPHPHDQGYVASSALGFKSPFSPSVPAELLIMELAHLFRHVCVYHHGSSTERYIHHSKVTFQELRV